MTDLKNSLKEAKNAIKSGDFKLADKCCKIALKLDKKNYQALVIFGKVNQELDKYADSKKVLMLATQVDMELPIAWQGLSNLHEKHPDIFTNDESLILLQKLLAIFKEEDKVDSLHRRIAHIYQEESPLKAATELRTLLKKLNDKNRIYSAWKSIIDLLSPVSEPCPVTVELLLEAFDNVLNDSVFGDNESNYQACLRLLHKTKDYDRLMCCAQKMSQIFPTAYPLEWIAKIFVQSEAEGRTAEVSMDDLQQYIEKLFRLYDGSSWGNAAMGLLFQKKGELVTAKPYLRTAAEKLKTNLFVWMQLIHSQESTHDIGGCEATCRKVIQIIQSEPDSEFSIPLNYVNLHTFLQSLYARQAKSLCRLGHETHLLQAIHLLENQSSHNVETYIILIKAYLNVGNIDNAEDTLNNLKDKVAKEINVDNSQQVKLLSASILSYREKNQEARQVYEDIIARNPSCAEALFELGKIHYLEKAYQKALITLLKAAKYDPKMSDAFLYLGHYYCAQENLEKARKCYEKALTIHGISEEVGSSLSDVYRKIGDHEANLSLLERVTSDLGRSGGGWAWFRLGLHYINEGSYNEAVMALQYATQICPLNSTYHECLGDAYLIRGSLSAALKIFERSVLLSKGDSLYQKCQMARIKHYIGEHLASIAEYEQILKSNPSRDVNIVAHVGLAQVLLTTANDHKKQKFFTNLKENCLRVIQYLTVVAREVPGYITVWKLLGDTCTMLDNAPESMSLFTVPKVLVTSSLADGEELLVELNKLELLQLGARCYGVGLRISESDSTLWHDLGANLLLQAKSQMTNFKHTKMSQVVPEGEEKRDSPKIDPEIEKCLAKSMSCLKKSLELESSNSSAWNNLAVAAFFKGNFALCQHSLLKSLRLQPSVEAWTHLGVLYLCQNDAHLAYEAFGQAQAQDPSSVSPWVGQALVAESIDHHDTFDLFRHANLLGIDLEACLGLSNYAIIDACDPSKSIQSQNQKVKALNATVSDLLEFYTRERQEDIVALNMYGLSLEINGMLKSASDIYAKATHICEESEKSIPTALQDAVLSNYSRTLVSFDKLDEAQKCYSKLSETDFHSACGLALAKLKDTDYEGAYQSYSSALYWLSEDSLQKSHILVALAFVQYKFKQLEQVKTLLFQSSCGDGRSVPGLFALTALGLGQQDPTLTAAALNELEPFKDDQAHLCDVVFLQSAHLILEGKMHEAKLLVSTTIRKHPQHAGLWRNLARLLITTDPSASAGKSHQQTKLTIATKLAEAASAAASTARVLSQYSGDDKNISQDCLMEALAYTKASKFEYNAKRSQKDKRKGVDGQLIRNKARLEAQRSVVMCPHKENSWAVLVAAVSDKTQKCRIAKYCSSKASPILKDWFDRQIINV